MQVVYTKPESAKMKAKFGCFFNKWVLWGLLCLCAPGFALLSGNSSYLGYGATPSARVIGLGQIMNSVSSHPVNHLRNPELTKQLVHWNVLYGAFEGIETGFSISRMWEEGSDGAGSAAQEDYFRSRLSLKYQFPTLNKRQPLLAIGTSDLFSPNGFLENLYFVSRKEWGRYSWKFALDLGALWEKNSNPIQIGDGNASDHMDAILPFFNFEFDTKHLTLLLENTYRNQKWASSPTLLWKPFSEQLGHDQGLLSLGIGLNFDTHYPEQIQDAWFSLNYQTGIHSGLDTIHLRDGTRKVSSEPILTWETSPQFDLFSSPEMSANRWVWKNDFILRILQPGFYWINGFDLNSRSTNHTSVLPRVQGWDRSYIQYFFPWSWKGKLTHIQKPVLMLGYFDARHAGFLWQQKLTLKNWRSLENEFGVFQDSAQDIQLYEKVKIPLHPKLPWIFKWSQFYADAGVGSPSRTGVSTSSESGEFYEESWYGGGRLTQFFNSYGSLDIGARYEVEKNSISLFAGIHVTLSEMLYRDFGVFRISAPTRWSHEYSLTVSEDNDDFYRQPTPRHTVRDAKLFRRALWKSEQLTFQSERVLASTQCDKPIPWHKIKDLRSCEKKDYDGDTIPNYKDLCPTQPEDYDGFQDANGCPEYDNDSDRLKDDRDECPLEPEDHDGFEDLDGCPDLDNDGDQILDVRDKCPMQREDVDGFQDNDGCPELDNDEDGILDHLDKCPDKPETKDGILDEDGCPDASDEDGIPWELDACPYEDEDMDGFQDEDGCPDPDNDSDFIPDEQDRCPMDPELMNGYQDNDGCPES